MKTTKTVKILLAAAMLCLPAASSADAAAAEPVSIGAEQAAQTANPWTDYQTKQEAQKAAGIKIKAPGKYFIYKIRDYRVMTENPPMLELVYTSIKGKGDYADTMTIRKSAQTGDISGDYADYEFIKELKVGKRSVTAKGNGQYFHSAVWQDGKYAYALMIDGGLTEKELTKLTAKIR